MKKRVKVLSTNGMFPNKAYKELYHEVEVFLRKANPCKICNGKCERGRSGGRNFCCGAVGSDGKGACKNCKPTGCTADRPLACRLWLCAYAEGNLGVNQKKKLNELRMRAGIFGNEKVMFRATRQDTKKIFLKGKVEKIW